MTIAVVAGAVFFGVALLGVAYIVLTRPRDVAARGERRHASTVLLALAFAAGLTASILDDAVLRGRPSAAAIVAGVFLIILGVVLRIAARRALGAAFSATLSTRQGQELVTTGPYRFIRHPAYLGSLILALGIGVSLGSPIGAAAMLVLCTAAIVFRIRREERLLREHFGTAYEEYARRTRRKLVPTIY